MAGNLHEVQHVEFLNDANGTRRPSHFAENSRTSLSFGAAAGIETAQGLAIGGAVGREFPISKNLRWLTGTPADWANESLALTREYVYPLPESGEITEEYAARALPVIHRRLTQAGFRVARLLTESLN
jgi:hypothetical protein